MDSNVAALEADLRNVIRGEVRFDAGTCAMYSTDASNYRQVPIGVVIPRDTDDVIQTVAVARTHGAPVLARGGGTSLAGQCCNVAVVLDFSKYINRILQIDPHSRLAQIEPGLVLDQLRDAAEIHHLTFGPDPATHNRCTLGGMIGNNSCGVHSVYSGKTAENIETIDVLTYRGLRLRAGKTTEGELDQIIRTGGPQAEIYSRLKALRDRYADLIRQRYPSIPRRVSGYNLDQLLPENGFHVARALVGSENTCVTVLSAAVNLVHSPPARSLVVAGYPDIASAADHVMEILSHKPLALEGIDDRLVDAMIKKNLHPEKLALLPGGRGWLLIEFGGETQEVANAGGQSLIESLKPPDAKLFDKPGDQRMIWKVRESGLGATAYVPGEVRNWEGFEDSAVPPQKVGSYLRDLRKLMDQHGYGCSLYGHFGDGCVHTRIDFDLVTEIGIRKFRTFMEEAADLVVSYGGSLSGEHGDGQSRGELLVKMFGPELVEAFREFKRIWDPDLKMNPGKVVDAYRLDENLRLGPDYNPAPTATHFQFSQDDGSLATATLRCVGVGECRKMKGGTMCPSYMVTAEERHSTRGRARLLFEMSQGTVIGNSWREESVREALDLCLACKACKSECPVGVDMATYKAEFLSHYYQGRFRPLAAYSMGLIHLWCRIASITPGVANLFLQSRVAKRLAGIAPERTVPQFAPVTFHKWFHERISPNPGAPKVLLWPDTFNNYFHPETAKAAVVVLEAAGYEVLIPSKQLCCGRPLYDYGMLPLAKRLLQKTLRSLRMEISAGIPFVGLEPSCVAVFRDELLNLFPNDAAARKLASQFFLLSEFLQREGKTFPLLSGKAIVHAHCHHRAIMGMTSEEQILNGIGVDYQILDSGCCGMAGSFGFEKEHAEISQRIGERVLLPAVRAASPDTWIISNGFSCREQIRQSTGRHALHLAEVLQLAVRSR